MVREPALAGILPVPGYLREPHGDQATSLEGAMGTDVGAVDAVVNLVAEVAAQTQLLGRKAAIEAAIEAARAGEVRKLARRPRDSGPEAAQRLEQVERNLALMAQQIRQISGITREQAPAAARLARGVSGLESLNHTLRELADAAVR